MKSLVCAHVLVSSITSKITLLRIARNSGSHRREKNVTLTDEANKHLYEELVEGFRTRDKSFGNARYAIGLLNEAKVNMDFRLMKNDDVNSLTQENLSTITLEDIEKIFGGKDKKKIHLTNEK